ncbi:MAG TPA: hypothetical protein VNF29_00350, partial [Candidatus Binataceae bacterium]|nr:hypothetical protein [Candidatus Binataceae bacterium]
MGAQTLFRQVDAQNYQPIRHNPMSYMQDLEARLKQLLSGIPEGEAAILIREIKTIVLESYRNGQQAG